MGAVVMVFVYWLSDIAVALWIGGFVAYWLLLQLPTIMPADPAPASVLVHDASLALGMLDQLRPVIVAASVILLASAIVGVIVERRRSILWWLLWIWRSATVVTMVAVALYFFGDVRSLIERLEDSSQAAVTMTIPVLTDSTAGVADAPRFPRAAISPGEDVAQDIRAAFNDFRARFGKWMWTEVLLGVMVLLTGAIREATWRRGGKDVPEEPSGANAHAETAESETDSPTGKTG